MVTFLVRVVRQQYLILKDYRKGIYEVKVSMTGFYLSKIAEFFTFDYKLYGLNQKFIDYVLKTYENTTGNLGVLLDGIKGTGKI